MNGIEVTPTEAASVVYFELRSVDGQLTLLDEISDHLNRFVLEGVSHETNRQEGAVRGGPPLSSI